MAKKFRINFVVFLWVIFFVFSPGVKTLRAQIPDICELNLPAGWKAKNGKISMNNSRFKTGNESVLWTWNKPKSFLQISDTAFGSAAENQRSSFVIWIYNEMPVNDSLLFEFDKEGKKASRFFFRLNFKGWRTAWIMYHRDMNGAPLTGMNRLTIHAPASIKKGALFLDQVIYHTTINPRSPMRDEQVPFVNLFADKAANAHWTALYWFSHNPHYLPLEEDISTRERQDLKIIGERFMDLNLSEERYKKIPFSKLYDDFNFWNIKRSGNRITGKAVYSVNDVELFPGKTDQKVKNEFKNNSISAFTELMLKVAGVYHVSENDKEKETLSNMFKDMLDHLEDQGWTSGSGMGALHHLGYNFRDYYVACLMMKPVLEKHGILERTWKTMHWFSGLGRTQVPPELLTESNIDVFNTLLGSMLATVLIMDDSPEKVRQMKEFSNWFSQALMPTYSVDRTFKPDGSVVHHGNLYPAYGVGGFQGITPIVYSLGKTIFGIQPEAHVSLKNVMLKMHYYSNPLKWPVGVSGRHPTGNWKVPGEAYRYMAMAGSPDGAQNIDRQMAEIYLRIIPDENNVWVKKFRDMNIEPSAPPAGHWNINYGLFDIHRRNDWLLTIRGHNRYFTTHEAYPGANVFGRYLSYGFLEVTYPQTAQDDGSSFKDKGWDWNHIPGATTLHVPVDHLRARILNVDDYSGVEEMLLSDAIFAGGTNLDQWQGLFSMELHGHDKYGMGSFKARKSWFMFDDLVICLGSDITNSIQDYPTHTTLFQNSLEQPDAPFYFRNGSNSQSPLAVTWNNEKHLSILDNRKIGYYLPGQKNVLFTKKEQHSRDQKDLVETTGYIATLYINHGAAPERESYEYAMKIGTSAEGMENFVMKMQSKAPVYKVFRKDSMAHSVYYSPEKITASALFQRALSSPDSLVISNSRPCLLMYQNLGDTVKMSVTDPDLAFYTGPDDSPVNEKGERQEVSIYSRDWFRTPSEPSMVVLTIRGWWNVVSEGSRVKATRLSGGRTQLSIPCEYGLASEFSLGQSK